jgi:hypothetical protein
MASILARMARTTELAVPPAPSGDEARGSAGTRQGAPGRAAEGAPTRSARGTRTRARRARSGGHAPEMRTPALAGQMGRRRCGPRRQGDIGRGAPEGTAAGGGAGGSMSGLNVLSRWLLVGEWRAHPVRAVLAVAAIAVGVAMGFAIHLINAAAFNEFSSRDQEPVRPGRRPGRRARSPVRRSHLSRSWRSAPASPWPRRCSKSRPRSRTRGLAAHRRHRPATRRLYCARPARRAGRRDAAATCWPTTRSSCRPPRRLAEPACRRGADACAPAPRTSLRVAGPVQRARPASASA